MRLRQIKSREEFNILMAMHELSPLFVYLNYGLIPPKKVQIGEDGIKQSISTSNQELLPQECRLNPARDLSKTLISIGIFVNPN